MTMLMEGKKMDNRVFGFLKTSLIYFVGQILSKLISVFLLPLYTAKIIPDSLGVYDYSISLLNLIVPIVFFQIWDGAFRVSFDREQSREKYCVINNALIIGAAGIIPCALIMACLSWKYGMLSCIYIVLYAVLYGIQYIYTFSARIFLDNALFAYSGIIGSLVTALLNVLLIVKLDMGINALYLAHIAGTFVQITVIEIKLKLFKNFRIGDIDGTLIKQLIKFSAPLCLATISYWLLSGFTRMMINVRLGNYYNGIFSVANKFASMVTFFIAAFQYAWNELAYSLTDKEDKTEIYSMFINISMKTLVYGCACLCLLIKIVFPFFIDPQYSEALDIIPIIMVGVAFNTIASLLSTVFMANKRTSYVMISTFIGAFVNVIFCVLLSKSASLYAMSAILTVSFVLLFLLRIVRLKKKKELNIDVSILFHFLISCGAYVVFHLGESLHMMIIVIAIYIVCYLVSMRKPIMKLIFTKGDKHENI